MGAGDAVAEGARDAGVAGATEVEAEGGRGTNAKCGSAAEGGRRARGMGVRSDL